MKKVIYLFAVVGLSLAAMSVAYAAKPFSQYTDEQKQYFYQCNYGNCYSYLAKGDNAGYQTCNKSCMSAAENYVPAGQHWCTDSDGLNYKMKGVITTDLLPNGISDYVYTWSNGKSAIFEGTCKNNRYQIVQKNCAEYGSKYKAIDGVCAKMNAAPEFQDGLDGTEYIIEVGNGNNDITINVGATDSDGDVLTFSAQNLPSGATFEKGIPSGGPLPAGVQYGILEWNPQPGQEGEYDVTLFVSDGMVTGSITVKIIVIVVDDCQLIVTKGAGISNTLVNGHDVPLLKIMISSNCDDNYSIETIEFDVANNPTYSKISSFHLYDWFGNPVSGLDGGVNNGYVTTAFGDYGNILEKGQTISYTLKADFEGLNYSDHDMVYVRLGYIILKNSTTAQQVSVNRGVQFDGIDNTLVY